MGIGLVADQGSVFIEKEITEGVYIAEASADKAVEVLSDGLEFTPTKELLERNNRTSTVEQVPSRVGQKSMAGTIPTEFKASPIEGGDPETSDLYESLLGGKDQLIEVTSLLGHTVDTIYLNAADLAQYKVGHIVKIKENLASGGEDHISPIKAIDTTLGMESITLLVPAANPFSDNVKIGAAVNYYHKSGQPTLSVTNYHGGKIREKAIGMRCVSAELADFSTGALPTVSFSLEGLDYKREVGQPLFSPAYDSQNGAEPPVVLCSKIYKDGQEIIVNSVGITFENTVSFLTSTASCSGKINSRITAFKTSFTIDPYMEDNNTDLFDLFDQNTGFSIFGSSFNSNAVNADKNQAVAFYMPNCRIPEITTGNQDGILTEQVKGTANKLLGNDTVFIAFL